MSALTPAEIKKNTHALAPLSQDDVWKLYEIERKAIARFKGQFDELEAAIGMLHLGFHVGWRPLVLIHDKKTIKKYEGILDIEIREFFPPEGPSSHRSLGYTLAKKFSNFWKVVSGEAKNDELKAQRREIA
jgi:hypothetical protein